MANGSAITIAEAEFVPLAEFRLGWRFTGERHRQQHPDRSFPIRPLGAAGAAALHEQLAAGIDVEGAFDVTFRSDDAPAAVRHRLDRLPPLADTPVLVSWDAATAAMTEWSVFVEHWDDFCYSASDDVTVLPLTGGWVLRYRRYDVIQFAAGPHAG